MKTHQFTVDLGQSGARLDVFLTSVLPDLSRRRIRSVIDVGGVYVNSKRIRIASRVVTKGDLVRFEYSEAALKTRSQGDLSLDASVILFDQWGVIAINKPPGLPSQATKDQAVRHVVPCLEKLLKDRGDTRNKLILVHRLDKETSGVLLVASSSVVATWLTDQFRQRQVKKIYLAVCRGRAKKPQFVETAPLSPIDRRTGDVRPVRAGGKAAVTHFKVLDTNDSLGLSLVECRPETGRSHQIRVHLAMNGLPIVGDKRYGGPVPSWSTELRELTQVHHFLHAAALEVVPGQGRAAVRLAAPLPPRMAAFLATAALTVPE